ncbi:flavin monoamine oxidase family protein [Embleya sp. NPDC008237]|uniref:flavin monoamine oxidase family protein n=1 Tax=Embleya sp. NPDC008237 TaxID=3363978 RepID=UPI0036EA70D8
MKTEGSLLRSTTRVGTPDPFGAALSLHREARRRGMPAAELAGAIAENTERRRERAAQQGPMPNRRRLLGAVGMAAAASALPGGLLSPSSASAAGNPRVVVVGAGLAGLRCAHRLWTGPERIAATVYEADTTHVGGRCWTLRNYFRDGQVSEHGGSFISTEDVELLALARRFGIETEIHHGGGLYTGDYQAWINHARYTTYIEDLEPFLPAVEADFANMGWPNHQSSTPTARRLDRMSFLDYMSSIGIDPRSSLGQMIQTRQLESGGEGSEVSALSFVGFYGSGAALAKMSASDEGGFDELYHLKGGNDQVVAGMVRELPSGSVEQGYELIAVRRNGTGSYTCTFDNCGRIVDVVADHVVLALPFRTLRNVDLSRAGLTSLKRTAIAQQGMGHHAKLVLQLNRKTWPAVGSNGITNTGPDGYQTAWDGSVERGDNGAPALLVNFPGGLTADRRYTGAAHGPAPSADVRFLLDQIENLLPGTRAAFNGLAWEDQWSRDPWHYGAYHYYKIGQRTTFGGYEAVQEGNVHFAGEHTSDYGATLNAAVVSGERAAGEILARI